MFRRLSVVSAAVALLGMTALPASAATTSHRPTVHAFGISGIPGISAWGNYVRTSKSVRVMLCVKNISPNVVLAEAAAVALGKGGTGSSEISVISMHVGATDCATLTTADTSALAALATSVTKDGKVHLGKPKVLYGNLAIGVIAGTGTSSARLGGVRALLGAGLTHLQP
jgi:hypothetical protein